MFGVKFFDLMAPFLCSLILSLVIIKVLHIKIRNYIKVSNGPQTIHQGSISRLGGISICLTIGIMAIINSSQEKNLFLLFFIISIPVFICGVFEDITQAVSPKLRLLGAMLSGVFFLLAFEFSISKIEILPIDLLLSNKTLSMIFTLLCIVYLIQAFNIIDGLNGLSLTTAILNFIAISVIAFKIDDLSTSYFSIYLIFVLSGVLVLNFPFGKIFLGDCGAYLIGLYVAIIIIIFAEKNTAVSSFVVVQILIYPSYELLRSFVRRLLSGKKNILKPDKKHLHSLLHTYNLKCFKLNSLKSNIVSSSQIICIQLFNLFYVINFYENKKIIIIGIFIFIILYEIFYNIINNKIKDL